MLSRMISLVAAIGLLALGLGLAHYLWFRLLRAAERMSRTLTDRQARAWLRWLGRFTSTLAALGLLLVVAACSIALLSSSFGRCPWSGGIPPAQDLTQMLSERLPAADVQAQRHQELVSAIRSLEMHWKLPPSSSQCSGPVGASRLRPLWWTLAAVGAACLVYSLLALFFSEKKDAVGRRAATGLVGLTLLSLGGVTLFKADIGPLVSVNPPSYVEVVQLCSIPSFPVGRHVLDQELRRRAAADLTASFRDRVRSDNVACIVLVGSADKRGLRGRVQSDYGCNAGLALARAASAGAIVDSVLVAGWPGDLPRPPVLLFNRGSSQIGPDVSEERYCSDRSVTVYLVGTRPVLK